MLQLLTVAGVILPVALSFMRADMCGIKLGNLFRSSTVALLSSSTPPSEQLFNRDAWVQGYTTCPKETCEILVGDIPSDLEGTYFKNGPAKFEFGPDLVVHPFDGDGMVTAITFSNGSAIFRNRFVRTKGFISDSKAKKIVNRGTFGTMKRGGMLANIFDVNFKNTANTNVIYWGQRLLALFEGGLPYKLDPDSLLTEGENTLRGTAEKRERLVLRPPPA